MGGICRKSPFSPFYLVYSIMTLQDRAKQELDRIKENPILNFEEKLNLAGWFNGEWTCACCGTMIGKNLKGESPFALARIHSYECSRK